MLRPDSLALAALLAAMVALGPLSTDLYLPSLPSLARSFGASEGAIQLTLSLFLAGFAVGQLIYGPLSDRVGRRGALLLGLAVFVAGSLGCLVAPTVPALLAARFVQAIGACAGPVLARAVVRDVYGRERAAAVLAYMGAAMAIAPTAGPILGGVLETAFGWRASFAVLTAYGAAALIGVSTLLPETRPPHSGQNRLIADLATLVRTRSYIGWVLAITFGYSGIFTFISGSSFVLIGTLGLDPARYGLAFAAVVLGYIVGTLAAGQVMSRLGLERTALAGAAICVVGGVAMALLAWGATPSVVALLFPMALYLAGCGLMLPISQAGAIAPFPTMAGSASSLLGFTQMTVAAGVGAVVGRLHDGTARPMAGFVLAAGVLALLSLTCLVRRGAHRGA